MDNKKTILFDPGYAPLVIDSLGQVGCNYYMFCAISDLKLKRMNFIGTSKRLEKFLDANIVFYLGCLLWGCYISSIEDCEIEGNQLLGEEVEEKEYTDEINFLIDFIEKQFPRDYKYFLNKQYKPDERYITILKTYKDFLILNKGFVKCSNTSQIVLPQNIKKVSKENLKLINDKIQNAIKEKNLSLLFECYDFIL